MSTRKKIQQYIIQSIKQIAKTDTTLKIYEDRFKHMSNKEFDSFLDALENGASLPLYIPHEDAHYYKIEDALKMAKKFNVNIFPKVKIDGVITSGGMMLNLPLRRAMQTIEKKRSIPTSDKEVDRVTGQVKGNSKGSKISYPETIILTGLDLNDSATEFNKYRGGDPDAYNALKKSIAAYGVADNDLIEKYSGKTGSLLALDAYFNGVHIKTNLKES